MPDPEPPTSVKAGTAKTVSLTERDVLDAARLLHLISDGLTGVNFLSSDKESQRRSSAEPPERDELVDRARSVVHTRRLRARHFGRAMFAEPAWDMLLRLYLADSAQERQTIGQLTEGIETALTTVLRWVGYLEKEELVERQDHPTDRRIVFIRLTNKGRTALEAYLTELPG
ncbi:MAG: MarR family transcriptional regulator [Pseudomonadota bacterium]